MAVRPGVCCAYSDSASAQPASFSEVAFRGSLGPRAVKKKSPFASFSAVPSGRS